MKKILIATLLLSGNALAQLGNFTAGNLIVTNNIAASNNISASSYTLNGDTITNWPSGGEFVKKTGDTMTGDLIAPNLTLTGSIQGSLGKGALRIETAGDGYLQLGPHNSSFSHFYTDRPRFYFNKEVLVDTGKIGSYNEDLQLRIGYGTKVTITTAGNVGIGTTNPEMQLHVGGTGRILQSGDGLNWIYTSLRDNGNGTSWQIVNAGHKAPHYNNEFHIMQNYAHSRLTIKDGGHIGIGTTSPQAKLHVVGNIIAAPPEADNHVVTKGYLTNAISDASDNLGNHTATQTLNINDENIINVNQLGGNVLVAEYIVAGAYKINDEVKIYGELYDENNNRGTSGQILSSTGSGIEWINPPAPGTMGTNALIFEVPSTNSLQVSGAISPAVDGCYIEEGQINGRPYYVREDGQFALWWYYEGAWELGAIEYLGEIDTEAWEGGWAGANHPWETSYTGIDVSTSPSSGYIVSPNSCTTEPLSLTGQDLANFATKEYVDAHAGTDNLGDHTATDDLQMSGKVVRGLAEGTGGIPNYAP